ncbi:sigma-70 family RNA polymerase sigma factor [bacterium]|nr:sigma-70 family RNA polymerase sigma factor [bacterium]
MANKYFIWKNSECDGVNPEWIEISGTCFFALMKTEGKKRYFKRIEDGKEDGADILIFETTYEDYKEWHRAQEKYRRCQKKQEQYKPQVMSLDDTTTDTEFTYNDVIPDTQTNVEKAVFKVQEQYQLEKIIQELNEKERLVIDIMLEAYDKEISERAVCRIRGVDQGTFAYRKKKVLNKIRNILQME